MIDRENLSEKIKLQNINFLTFFPEGTFTCVYTSAAVGPIFNLKVLHTAIESRSRWCFLSGTCVRSYKNIIVLPTGSSELFVKSSLLGSNEARPIHIIYLDYFKTKEIIDQVTIQGQNLLIKEFERKVSNISLFDLMARRWERTNRIRISIEDVLLGKDEYLLQYQWIPYEIMNIQLSGGEIPVYIKKQFILHFKSQYFEAHEIHRRLFPLIAVVPNELRSYGSLAEYLRNIIDSGIDEELEDNLSQLQGYLSQHNSQTTEDEGEERD